MIAKALKTCREEVLRELEGNILRFWLGTVLDPASRGFHGAVNSQGKPDPGAPKGLILATRMLWTFSRASISLGPKKYLQAADLMFSYIRGHFLDQAHGGVYWMLDAQGRPLDRTKKFYGQAFAIYALAEYHKAAGSQEALAEAKGLFRLVEEHGRDRQWGGYVDAVGEDWAPIADTRLSEKDLNTPKSMNTMLHIMEAYSSLTQCGADGDLLEALGSLVRAFHRHILLPNRHFGLFFDMDWKEIPSGISYGHDIEGSWLLDEAARNSGDEALIRENTPFSLALAQAVMEEGMDAEGGVLNERGVDGALHQGREWWMQAEGMVGLLNAYGLTGNTAFAEKSLLAWDFAKKKFIRPGGEWYGGISDEGVPDTQRVLAGPWKCPYHNARACFEVAERIEKLV